MRWTRMLIILYALYTYHYGDDKVEGHTCYSLECALLASIIIIMEIIIVIIIIDISCIISSSSWLVAYYYPQ